MFSIRQERQQHLRAWPTDDFFSIWPTYRKDCTPNVRPSILSDQVLFLILPNAG